MTESITQHGITWTFNGPVGSGQFVNGDYWVVDPGDGVRVVGIQPGPTLGATGRRMNGSMLNPSTAKQGYDSARNYTPGVTAPLTLTGDCSLVSTISNPDVSKDASYVKSAAVLTCLSEAPPEGSFRPGISSEIKTLHNVDDLDLSLLRSLPCPGPKPNIDLYAAYLQMTWLTHDSNWTSRYMHPSASGLNNYYYSSVFATAALLLHLDYTPNEKHRLLINYIQLGLDIYSYIEAGGKGWPPDGGHSSGRKWPILFAGIMLDYMPMWDIGKLPPSYFGEDGQTFYVWHSDIDITNSPRWNPDRRSYPNAPYTPDMLGMPEWGIRNATDSARSDAAWNAQYRTVNQSWAGTALAARIMDVKRLWNHNAHFAYVDRYMAITAGKEYPFGYSAPGEKAGGRPGGLIGLLWDRYRGFF